MTDISSKRPKWDKIKEMAKSTGMRYLLFALVFVGNGCNKEAPGTRPYSPFDAKAVADSLHDKPILTIAELDSIDELLQKFGPQADDLPMLSQAFRELGRRYTEVNAFGPACMHYLKAHEVALKAQDAKQETHALMSLGSIFFHFKDYERSIEYFEQALVTGKELNDGDHLAWTHHEMVKSALQAEKYDEARLFAEKGLRVENIKEPFWRVHLNNDIGLAYFRQKKYPEALAAYQKAVAQAPNMPHVTAFVDGNIGALLLESNQPAACIPYLLKDIALSFKNEDYRSVSGAAIDLSSAYLQLNDRPNAQKYLELADSLILANPEKNFSKKRFTVWTMLLAELKNPKESLAMHRTLIEALKKQLAHEMDENNKQLRILVQMMESHDKLKESQIVISEEKRTRLRFFYLSVLLVVVLVGSISYFRSRNRIIRQMLKIESLRAAKNEQELQIMAQQKQLQAVELELQKEMADNLSLRLENSQRLQTHMELTKGFLEDLSHQLVGAIDETLQNGQNLYPQVRAKLEGSLRLFQQANYTKSEIELPSNEDTNNFIHRIKQSFPELTNDEVKLCTYLRLNMSTKEIANIKMITIAGVNKSRNRIRKKLGLTPTDDLNQFLQNH